MSAHRFASMLLGAVLGCGMNGLAGAGPQPPCGNAPFPAYPSLDSPPVAQVWGSAGWTPPSCTGWAASDPSTLVAVVSRFRHNSGLDGLRRRIGAVSELAGMLYWSTSNQGWRPLIASAYALSGPAGDQPRKDFSPEEVAEGRNLYFQQEDSLFGKAAYRVRVLSASANRIVFATENSGAIRYLGIPVFPPGEIQAICFLERESEGVWRYYSIARIGKQASLLTAGHEASLINRAVASYRYLAGVPLDKEPPAAR